MTAYWDEQQNRVTSASELGEVEFLAWAEAVEAEVIEVACLLVGDREVPSYWRELVLGRVAVLRVGPLAGVDPASWPPTRGRSRTATARRSALVDSLHRAWHGIAEARIDTRFGRLTDDPAADLRARDNHDQGGTA